MRSTGITRKLDELGRLVVPKETRSLLDITPGTSLAIFVEEDGTIILRKAVAKCALCGQEAAPEDLHKYKQALLCSACLSELP